MHLVKDYQLVVKALGVAEASKGSKLQGLEFASYIIAGMPVNLGIGLGGLAGHVPFREPIARSSVGETAAKTAKSAPTPQRHPIKRLNFSHQNIDHKALFPSEKSCDRFRMAY